MAYFVKHYTLTTSRQNMRQNPAGSLTPEHIIETHINLQICPNKCRFGPGVGISAYSP
ncbi:hypothetical protein CY34DRAFT_156110 [Suillus luteus UH-Slu-Lm8-n1]|uniref:Uncharacterized protein n=1 Tax=Suillus luteus UH-Slu-Lm8-n1 TaxID=930992 RepID=A0A0D0A2N2_9AGAM|nr:hypothetical protein CY34DRAFT_156110 [Suillus luteus UH-Slu-Lm8-n1]